MVLKDSPKSDAALAFTAQWRQVFGEWPPFAWVLRCEYQERWTRFHALPDSKRYASNPSEYEEILTRARTLFEACFPDEDSVWVTTVGYDGGEELPPKLANELGMDFVFSWVDPRVGLEHQTNAYFYCCRRPCVARTFDEIFKKVADEEARAVFFSEQSGIVYAPYDGGFDLICRDVQQVQSLEQRFEAWISAREDRL